METAKNEQEPAPGQSMEDILKTIRNVISGDDTEGGEVANTDPIEEGILELSDVVQDDGSIVSIKDDPTNAVNRSSDVLDNIDTILKNQQDESGAVPDLQSEEAPQITEQAVEMEILEEQITSSMEEPAMEATLPEAPPVIEELPALPEISVQDMPEIPQLQSMEEPQSFPTADDSDHHAKKPGLITEENATASAEAMKLLLKSVSKQHTDGLSFRSGTTVEDLVIELLKPQLSEWLNHHLPGLVKHVVEKEIQKLIPREDD